MIEKLIESVKVKPICLQRRWSCSWSAAELQSDRNMPVDKLALLHLPLQSYCVQCSNNLLPPLQPHLRTLCCFHVHSTNHSSRVRQWKRVWILNTQLFWHTTVYCARQVYCDPDTIKHSTAVLLDYVQLLKGCYMKERVQEEGISLIFSLSNTK